MSKILNSIKSAVKWIIKTESAKYDNDYYKYTYKLY